MTIIFVINIIISTIIRKGMAVPCPDNYLYLSNLQSAVFTDILEMQNRCGLADKLPVARLGSYYIIICVFFCTIF
ncbi:hypothetical protein NIES3275_41080 [Microchaete diplosiphon NIES-3275]|nr:hypothetical protein NIES3275_41080 [Microchaete diplosiphon NIES-3275]